jgi:hypothetical protein
MQGAIDLTQGANDFSGDASIFFEKIFRRGSSGLDGTLSRCARVPVDGFHNVAEFGPHPIGKGG